MALFEQRIRDDHSEELYTAQARYRHVEQDDQALLALAQDAQGVTPSPASSASCSASSRMRCTASRMLSSSSTISTYAIFAASQSSTLQTPGSHALVVT